jgi:signal transduction histidine kinase
MRRRQYAEGLKTIMQTANQLAAPRMEIGRKRTEHMRRLAVELMQAEHDERRRISEVIHEDVMQTLAAINMNLESAHKEDDLSATILQTKKMMQDALAKLRGLTIDLRSEKLSEKGLIEGLRWLVEQMQQTRDLLVELRSDNTIEPLSIEVQVFLYNAARKLLDNVAVHSHTNHARLEVKRIDEQHVRLIVSDEGVGFIVGRLDVIPSRSFGLASIREQAELLGGHLDVDSSPGHGMRAVLTVSA